MINYLAVLIAAVIGYVISMFWYSPLLFGTRWLKLTKIKNPKPTVWVIVLGFIATLIFNYVMALLVDYAGITSFGGGAVFGILLWIGFIATTLLSGVLYRKESLQLYWIDTVPYLISMALICGLFGAWQ